MKNIINSIVSVICTAIIGILVFSNSPMVNALDTWTWAGGVMLSFAILAMSLTDLLANIVPEEEV